MRGPINLCRLGQFTSIEPDDDGAFFDALDKLLAEWDDLDEETRPDRIDEVAALRAPDAFGAAYEALPVVEKLQMMERRNDVRMEIIVAAASGSSGLPLGDRGAAWDAGAADKRVRAWAGATDKPNAKYGNAFFWKASGGGDKFGDYKLGFADVVNGKLTAIPKGIFAAAGAINGARGGVDIPSGDVGGVKSRINGYYKSMAKKFGDDNIKAPWMEDAAPITFTLTEDGKLVANLTPAEARSHLGLEPEALAVDDTGANVPDVPAAPADTPTDDRWHAILLCENVTTNDGRQLSNMSIRPLPLPLMYMTEKGIGGHVGAQLGGNIDSIMRDGGELLQSLIEAGFDSLGADGATLFIAEGGYAPTPDGAECRDLINSQMLRFISVDAEILDAEEVFPLGETGEPFLRVTRGNVMGGTACPFPAFQQCIIAPVSMSLFDAATQSLGLGMAMPSAEPTPVAVAASAAPAIPPAAWFSDPRFGPDAHADTRLVEDPDHLGKFYCPHTVTADGRVFGHAAAWHREHIAFSHKRVFAPRSASDYAHYAVGTVLVDRDGEQDIIRCGIVTMNTGHAETTGPRSSAAAAKAHYDNTGTQIAFVEIGEDEHGIWYTGALSSSASEEDVIAFRAGGVSGDWRPVGNATELVALLAVNTPGFPCPRPRRAFHVVGEGEDAQERDLALVAAGFVPPRDPVHEFVIAEVARQVEMRMARITRQLDAFAPILVERLDAQLG